MLMVYFIGRPSQDVFSNWWLKGEVPQCQAFWGASLEQRHASAFEMCATHIHQHSNLTLNLISYPTGLIALAFCGICISS